MNQTKEESSEAQSDAGGGNIAFGAILCVFAAFIMACSMTLQRYALAYPEDMVPLCCSKRTRLPRMRLWFLGLVVYGIANGFYTVGLNFAPLSMCGAIFATVLVFNLFFASFFLGEQLSKKKVLGCMLVLVGVVVCALSAPSVETAFEAPDIEVFASAPTGWCYFVILISILIVMMIKCFRFEKEFPIQGMASVDVSQHSATFALMSFIYPCSLGIQEGLCQLGLKGWVTMLFAVFGGSDDLTHYMFWLDTAVTVFFCVLALRWLELVYRRCETSQALPVEYGTVTAVAVCSGILFFQEYKLMDTVQLLIMIVGVLVLSGGIALCSSSSSASSNTNSGDIEETHEKAPARRSSLEYLARGPEIQRRPSKDKDPLPPSDKAPLPPSVQDKGPLPPSVGESPPTVSPPNLPEEDTQKKPVPALSVSAPALESVDTEEPFKSPPLEEQNTAKVYEKADGQFMQKLYHELNADKSPKEKDKKKELNADKGPVDSRKSTPERESDQLICEVNGSQDESRYDRQTMADGLDVDGLDVGHKPHEIEEHQSQRPNKVATESYFCGSLKMCGCGGLRPAICLDPQSQVSEVQPSTYNVAQFPEKGFFDAKRASHDLRKS